MAFAQSNVGGVKIVRTEYNGSSIPVDHGFRNSMCNGEESSLDENGLRPSHGSVENNSMHQRNMKISGQTYLKKLQRVEKVGFCLFGTTQTNLEIMLRMPKIWNSQEW